MNYGRKGNHNFIGWGDWSKNNFIGWGDWSKNLNVYLIINEIQKRSSLKQLWSGV